MIACKHMPTSLKPLYKGILQKHKGTARPCMQTTPRITLMQQLNNTIIVRQGGEQGMNKEHLAAHESLEIHEQTIDTALNAPVL
ncbi:hypothetical protein PAESOLCIP111_03670 [Paenibacillus solanacearum]|uniref:Uncharacterized protein n=1 Tax=Paenibacillus solanacearum TaxID=2048548 RepID=A0A916K2X9_9BACL|nr:hypothetical protein PAESOLCIP111_03670 [Paenibacillus solanacearum]